jgi:hypothetical protein
MTPTAGTVLGLKIVSAGVARRRRECAKNASRAPRDRSREIGQAASRAPAATLSLTC